MSKGSSPRRPSVSPEEFAQKFDAINWNARDTEKFEKTIDWMNSSPAFTLAALVAEIDKEQADAPQPE
jgi:hypothetical protein